MWSDEIKAQDGIPFCGASVEAYFGTNFFTPAISSDVSMMLTTRALLVKRTDPKTDNLKMVIGAYSLSLETGSNDEVRIRDLILSQCATGYFRIVKLKAQTVQGAKEFLDHCDEFVPNVSFAGNELRLHPVKDIPPMAERFGIRMRVYIDEESRTGVALIHSFDISKWHWIQCCIPKMIPWFFKEVPLTPSEVKLLGSLNNGTAEDYIKALAVLESEFDFRSASIKKLLGNFSKNSRNRQMELVNESIDEVMDEIRSLMEEYTNLIKKKDDLGIQLMGLLSATGDDPRDAELTELFTRSKQLSLLSVEDSRLRFLVETYITNWDPDVFDMLLNNENSYLYTRCSEVRWNKAQRRKFFEAIFGEEPRFKIRTVAMYEVDLRGFANTESHFYYERYTHDRVPNPHLNHFACLGTNEMHIVEQLRKGDVIGAIMQCMASACSMNIGEPPTMIRFMNDILYDYCLDKIFEDSKGKCFNTKEVFEMLEKGE